MHDRRLAVPPRARPHAAPLALAFLVGLGISPGLARAVPVVFTASGQLGASGAPTDTIQLAFSTVRLTLAADTTDAPAHSSNDGTQVEAHYRPASGLLEFTNRPGGAPDLAIPYAPDLVTLNVFDPSATPDRFEIADGSTMDLPGSPQFFVSGFRVSFLDATFYPGTGAGPLPGFDATGGAVVFGVFYDVGQTALYSFSNPVVTFAVVPEPEGAVLLGLGLAGLTRRALGRPGCGRRREAVGVARAAA